MYIRKADILWNMNHSFLIGQRGRKFSFELQQTGRTFLVLSAKDVDHPHLRLGFSPKGVDEVLDTSSDAWQVFSVSTKVRVADCVLGTTEMRAPDVDALKNALAQVRLTFWDSEEL